MPSLFQFRPMDSMQARTAKYLFGFFAWHVVLFFFLRRQPKYEAPVLGPMLPFPSVSLTPAFDSQLRGCANFTRVLVIPKTKAEDVDWVQRAVDAGWGVVFYHVDGIDPSEVDKTSVGNGTIDGASESWGRVEHRRTPSNKGHEVIAYLSYIIEYYYNLPEISVFLHAHHQAWHNPSVFDFSAVETLLHLNCARVARIGYMNLRCTHDPGCPVWLEPYKTEEVLAKQEQSVIGKVWNELFPEDVLPEVLAQPCCAQFGVSRPAITRLRIERWILWRDWIMMTPLTDYFSGRIWEFLWQFILSGNPISCPEESSCYCDGYGLCFGGPQAYSEFEKLHKARLEAAKELEVAEINSHGVHDVEHLKERLEALATEEKKLIEEALERGNDPVARAEELTGEDEL